MRIRSLGALAGVLLIATACAKAATPVATTPAPAAAVAAPAPAPAATVNPLGRWTVALTAQGKAYDFMMDLRHVSGEEYAGTLTSKAFPTMTINKATRAGNAMFIKIDNLVTASHALGWLAKLLLIAAAAAYFLP
jgi:hypothetical protein